MVNKIFGFASPLLFEKTYDFCYPYFMNSRNRQFLILSAVAIIIIASITGFVIYNNDLKSKSLGSHIPAEQAGTEVLREFLDVANQLSGIMSGAVFNYSLVGNGNPTNFGIMDCRDEVRCDLVAEKQVAKFQQPNQPSPDTAEVDTDTNMVVSLHRAVPSFVGGELPQEEVERIMQEFLLRVYPEFESIKSNLTFDLGMKDARLNNGNYFFRWNDKRYAVPDGLTMDLPPFIQVGITAGGFIFSYTNTIPLYRELLRDDLRKLCAYVEMPFSDDSAIDTENGIVTVWYMDKQNNNRYLLLPYEPRTDFEGCSESAKEKLEHIRGVDDQNRANGFYD